MATSQNILWTNSYSMAQTGAFLRTVRRDRGITQDDFADMIGVSHATLSALENGKSVSTHTLEHALSYLGLRIVIVPKNADVAPLASKQSQGGE